MNNTNRKNVNGLTKIKDFLNEPERKSEDETAKWLTCLKRYSG